jgi:transcriptional regulator with XRE-family HTH domain
MSKGGYALQSLLREARVRSGLTQRALAKRAGTTQAVIARIELGTTSPTLETLRRLLRASGFDVDARLAPRLLLDRQLLDDVPRILRLSPEDRLREVANLNRFVAIAERRG